VLAGFFVTAGDSLKTFSPKPHDIERRWYVIDAEGAVLGRLASEVAKILRGKHKPIFAPHADTGDHVIVVNAMGVRLTGGKEEKKVMYRHSGYPGGIRGVTYGRLMAERPKFAVERAIKGMLPSNRLGRQMAKKLSVYDGPTHPHTAQRPEPLPLGQIPKWEGLPKPKPKPVRAAAPAEALKKSAGRRGTAKPAAAKTTAKRGGTGTSGRTTRPAGRGTGSKAGAAKTPRDETTSSRAGAGGRKRSASTEKASTEQIKSTEQVKKTGRSRRSKKTEES
jgi:large subunit ribosomal protein L13